MIALFKFAFKAFSILISILHIQSNASPAGTCTANDIVDGHRERTLALLWALIQHRQLAALLDAPRLAQEVRALEASLAVKRRLRHLKHLETGRLFVNNMVNVCLSVAFTTK